MKTRAALGILLVATCASAHRLDEYLEATIISLEPNHLHAQVRLTPGVAVVPTVLAAIDTNNDGVISSAEQIAYADKVLRDLSFAIDASSIHPRLASVRFPPLAAIKEGLGDIYLEVDADLPRGGATRKLTFENHHEFPIAAYLVNALVPRAPEMRIIAQRRNYSQSSYELEFTSPRASLKTISGPIRTAAVLLLAALVWLWRRLAAGFSGTVIGGVPAVTARLRQ